MDKEICKKVITHQNKLVPALFTKRQIELLKKYLHNKKFTPSEKTYLYGAISKKITALGLLKETYHITGSPMILERVAKAKELLRELGEEKAFISGSFLYKKDFQDIDIFIVGKKRKQLQQGNHHNVYLTESDLRKPLFFSAAKYSVSTFPISVKPIIKKERLSELFLTYQQAINEVLENKETKTVRQLLFFYYLYVKKEVIDAYHLYQRWRAFLALPQQKKIEEANHMAKMIIKITSSARYLYEETLHFQQGIEEAMKEYPTDNLPIYLNFAEEVKHGCRAAEAEN